MDRQPLLHLRARTQTLDVRLTAAHTAALVGAEWFDGLAGEIEMLQESKYAHWHCSPIVGITKIDCIVSLQTLRVCFQLRAGISPLVILSLGNAGVIVVGIRLNWNNLKQFSACDFRKQVCGNFRIAKYSTPQF